jgi:hypothetical protein
MRTREGEAAAAAAAAAAAEVASTLISWGAQAPAQTHPHSRRKPPTRLSGGEHGRDGELPPPRAGGFAADGPQEPAREAAAAAALVSTCRDVEGVLARCGLSIEEQLCYVMDFSALPAVVQAAQWDALRRWCGGGNYEAVAACIRRQLAKQTAGRH